MSGKYTNFRKMPLLSEEEEPHFVELPPYQKTKYKMLQKEGLGGLVNSGSIVKSMLYE